MNVGQLMNMLKAFPSDSEIVFSVPTENYWGQIKAAPITDIQSGVVVRSEYLDADQILSVEDQDNIVIEEKNGYYEDNEVRAVYVLS